MAIMRTLTLNGVTYAVESSVPTATTVTLKAADWLGDTSPYSQVVAVGDVTPLTKVDLQPTMDQVDTLYSQSVGFFTMNEGGVVRAFAVGNKPTEDFVIQITLTEVEGGGARIKGNTIGFPNPQPDWNQTDAAQADFIKNKIPAYVDKDGYTVIDGQRQPVSVSLVKSGDTVTVTTVYDGNQTRTDVITLNDEYPVKLVCDGREVPLGWEGFE